MTIFCALDDCCNAFEPVYSHRLLHIGQRQRTRQTALTLSAMLTLVVYFPWSHYRTGKHDYTEYVAVHLRPSCPRRVSYRRCVELIPRARIPLCGSLSTRTGRCTAMACIDATPLTVCAHHRLATHKVLAGLARRGKTSMGWF